MKPAIELRDVACTFISKDAPGQRYTAVEHVNLTVGAGEFVSVVGPTGCGKSTLLNVAAGLLAPSKGTAHVFGEPLRDINTRAGYMFQTESLMPWRTALQNVMAGLEFRGVPEPEARAQAEDWLRRVGLGGFGDRYPHQLSGGMRKRTSLAQTLVLDPDIILMDEPFSALDIQTRQLMENEVLALWAGEGGEGRRAAPSPERSPTGGQREAQGGYYNGRRAAPSLERSPSGGQREAQGGHHKRKAVLFITHDLDEAIAKSDRVVILSAGPAARAIGEFSIDIERPRDVAEVKKTPRFLELHAAIWAVLREEVLKGYQQQLQKAA